LAKGGHTGTRALNWSYWPKDSAYGYGWAEGYNGWKHVSIYLYRPETHGHVRYFSRLKETVPGTVVQWFSYNWTWHFAGGKGLRPGPM
jgi:hypothetical protein